MTIETWILIIWMQGYREAALHSVEFNSRQACEVVMEQWRGKMKYTTNGAICVKK